MAPILWHWILRVCVPAILTMRGPMTSRWQLRMLPNQKLAGLESLTLSEYATRICQQFGTRYFGARPARVQSTVVDLLNTQRSEVSGVSMDEEVSNMVQYQQAYQASSRYFNVLSEMMDTLINSLG